LADTPLVDPFTSTEENGNTFPEESLTYPLTIWASNCKLLKNRRNPDSNRREEYI